MEDLTPCAMLAVVDQLALIRTAIIVQYDALPILLTMHELTIICAVIVHLHTYVL